MIPFPCTLIILALLENSARVLHRPPGGGTVPQRSVARTRRLLLGDQATHVLQDHRAPHQLRRLPEPARVHSGHESGLPELLQVQCGESANYDLTQAKAAHCLGVSRVSVSVLGKISPKTASSATRNRKPVHQSLSIFATLTKIFIHFSSLLATFRQIF